jgi:hypothetical protein
MLIICMAQHEGHGCLKVKNTHSCPLLQIALCMFVLTLIVVTRGISFGLTFFVTL